MNLIAPRYLPAKAYERPAEAPYVMSLKNTSLAELMANQAAWAIVIGHLPMFKAMVSNTMIKPHLGNMTVGSLSVFVKTATPETLAAIDAELAKLPPTASP